MRTASKIILPRQNQNYIKPKRPVRFKTKSTAPITQRKSDKKEDSFSKFVNYILSFFISNDSKSSLKPAVKRSSKQTLKLPRRLLKKPRTKVYLKISKINRSPIPHPPAVSKKRDKSVTRNPHGLPSKEGVTVTDRPHQQVHKGEVRDLVVELHKTVNNILSKQNINKPSTDETTPLIGDPAINTRQATAEEQPSSPLGTFPASSVKLSSANLGATSVGPTSPPVSQEGSRFEPFVPNYLQLENGQKSERTRPSETQDSNSAAAYRTITPASPNHITDCTELVSDCYEQLLDNKIIELQSEMERFEKQYWGDQDLFF